MVSFTLSPHPVQRLALDAGEVHYPDPGADLLNSGEYASLVFGSARSAKHIRSGLPDRRYQDRLRRMSSFTNKKPCSMHTECHAMSICLL